MKGFYGIVALLVLLQQGAAFAGRPRDLLDTEPVTCPGAVDASCQAFSTLEILTTSGTCKGRAAASCETISTAKSDFKEAFEEWWGEEGMCDSGKAEVAVTAIARAAAAVWANAAVSVTCDGRGFGCGWAASNGNTYALAYAEAIAQAAAETASEESEAFCFADVRAVNAVLAEAAAAAQADACTTGGTQEDFEESFVEAVKEGLASAFASATASACDDEGEALAFSECNGEGRSESSEKITALGNVCGGTTQLQACTGTVANKCCSSGRNLCTCRRCNGPWTRRSKRGDAKLVYGNRAGDSCFCKDDADEEPVEEEPKEQPKEEPKEEPKEPETPVEPEQTPEETEDPKEPATPVDVEETDVTEEPKEKTPEEPKEEEKDDSRKESRGAEAKTVCPGAVDTSCSAYSTLEIEALSGTCKGRSSASCEAVTEANNAFVEAFEEWYSAEEGVCDSGAVVATAKAVASAIAEVWVEAAAKVTCDGQGFACGWAAANGEAWAQAFAESVAQAAAEASSGDAEGFCFADIRAISTIVADAAASAQADTCTEGGTAEDYQDSFATAIQTGIAEAFAKASATACNADGELIADSLCLGNAESTTEGEVYAHGDACAGIAQIRQCKGPGADMCCASDFTRTLCSCNRKGCANGPWIKKSELDTEKNTFRSFADRKGNTCFCL